MLAASLLFVACDRTEAPAPPAPAPSASPSPARLSAADVKRLRQHLQAALLAEKPGFVKRCYRAEPAGPPQVKLVFDVLFDAEGREIGRGVREVRGMDRAEVASCIRQEPLGLRIPAPGRQLSLQVAILLP